MVARLHVHGLDDPVERRRHREVGEGGPRLLEGDLGEPYVLLLLRDRVRGRARVQLVVARLRAGEARARTLEGGARLIELALVGGGAQVLEPRRGGSVVRPRGLHRKLRLAHVLRARFCLQLLESRHGRRVARTRRLHRKFRLAHVLRARLCLQLLESRHRRGVVRTRRLYALLGLVAILL